MGRFVNARNIMVVAALVVGATIVLALNAVDNSLSDDDLRYLPRYLTDIDSLQGAASYTDELNYIRAVQRSVLHIAPVQSAVPLCQKREPKEVYEAKAGQCSDRSRVIEKILRYSGFETRHVSIYSTVQAGSALRALLTPGTPSHAITEVLTRKGWLVVDSNDAWVATDATGSPVSIQAIRTALGTSQPIAWDRRPPAEIYEQPFTYLYGLYSRHGRFYPPYNFIPDIHYGEFAQNIL